MCGIRFAWSMSGQQIIAVPQIPDAGSADDKKEFDRLDTLPEHAQCGNRYETAPHLRLDDSLPEGNALPRHEADIHTATQERHWQEIRRVPVSACDDTLLIRTEN